MQISYFGLGSFKITNKNYTTVINPFSKESGLIPPRGGTDVILLSDVTDPINSYTQSLSGDPFVIDTPGEYDVKDFAIDATPIRNDGRIITAHLIQTEGITILNLGNIFELKLTEDEIEDFGDIDILLLPVGGNGVMDFSQASKAANLLEPKIIIPMYYKIPNLKIDFDSSDRFVKQFGGKAENMDKLNLKKKDLLAEESVKIIILEPLR
jgi:hypothetical protein